MALRTCGDTLPTSGDTPLNRRQHRRLRSLRSATMDDARAALEAAGERQANIDTYAVRVAGLIPSWVRHYNPRHCANEPTWTQ